MKSTSYKVSGLDHPVQILVDRWGVPHIRAATTADVFVAQGFNAARERLFQIDLWRRRGLGLLSEVFGPEHLERDRAARLFLYRGDMRDEWDAYGPGAEEVVRSFTVGVNAYVAETRSRPDLVPVEFRELGYLPAFWHPEDIVRIRSHGWYGNLEQEVERARVLGRFGREVEDLRQRREGPAEMSVPSGLDLSLFNEDVLRLYRLATRPVSVTSDASVPVEQHRHGDGSNCWVVDPSRTSTGRPILASDPHRALTLPSLRYITHLAAPGLNLIGAGEPCLPGISIGHNGQVAFGLTVFSIDQEDLYVYDTRPGHPREYWYNGAWEAMRREVEAIPVRGGSTVEIDLWFTRHGPVIHEVPARHAAFAPRAAWLGAGMAPYMGSLALMNAATGDAVVEALDGWGAPGENYLYAANDGAVGQKSAGRVPIRPNWDGSLPVPGDGRYEWAGFLDAKRLPGAKDPVEGWLASANQYNLSPALEREVTVGRDWPTGFRYERIAERLAANNDWSIAECLALQHDYLSLPYTRLRPMLASIETADPEVRAALRVLLDWDGVEAKDSAGAALFEIWLRGSLRTEVRRSVIARCVEPDARVEALNAVLPWDPFDGDPRIDLDLLLSPSNRPGLNAESEIDDVVSGSLREAYCEARKLLGPDVAAWEWGSIHQARLTHIVRSLLPSAGDGWGELPEVARGGSADTVGCAWLAPDYSQVGGASFRMVVDVGAWDNSIAMNCPGQSGRPESAHYQDLLQLWAEDSAFPLVYSDEAVAAAATETVMLEPAEGPDAHTQA